MRVNQSMERDELAAWLRLTLTPGVGNEAARKLLAAFGLPAAVFTQPLAALAQVVSRKQAESLLIEPTELPDLLDITWSWLAADPQRHHVIALGDAAYPQGLLTIEDPPLMLYVLGTPVFEPNRALAPVPQTSTAIKIEANACLDGLRDCAGRSIAIVGSRNPTPQGAGNARQFARALSEAGLTIISGLALGVDGAAHEGALDALEKSGAEVAGPRQNAQAGQRLATIAVVGTGLDRVYPKTHRDLAHRIAENGLIVSEYPLGTPPLAANFPRRNRLIAGLSQGTLVVEAALASGSLITARLAVEQGKDVFAIPGSIHAAQARGCHALIKQGAKLVESAQDVLEELKIIPRASETINSIANIKENTGAKGLFDSEDEHESPLLEALGFDPVGLDALQARTGLPTAQLQADLMALELQGLVARLPGGLFQRQIVA